MTNDNKCFAVGRKEYGRLGLGELQQHVEVLTPIDALNKVKVVDIDCGENNSYAVTEDGKAFVWGMGSSNQLGTGNEEDVLVPTMLESAQVRGKKLLRVSGGGQHALFIVQAEEAEEVKVTEKKASKAAKQKDAPPPAVEKMDTEPAAEEPSKSTEDDKEPEPVVAPPPAKTKGRKGKAAATNKTEKTNGNHTDKPQNEAEPEPAKTETTTEKVQEPTPDSTEKVEVESVKETASDAGSVTSSSDKSGKRSRKRKLN